MSDFQQYSDKRTAAICGSFNYVTMRLHADVHAKMYADAPKFATYFYLQSVSPT